MAIFLIRTRFTYKKVYFNLTNQSINNQDEMKLVKRTEVCHKRSGGVVAVKKEPAGPPSKAIINIKKVSLVMDLVTSYTHLCSG